MDQKWQNKNDYRNGYEYLHNGNLFGDRNDKMKMAFIINCIFCYDFYLFVTGDFWPWSNLFWLQDLSPVLSPSNK